MIKEQYISFETAKLAKEKGFDGQSRFAFGNDGSEGLPFDKDILMPTQSVLARWLREVHNMCVEVYSTGYGFIWCICDTDSGTDRRFSNETGSNDSGAWDTYEEAMEAGLQEALQLIK